MSDFKPITSRENSLIKLVSFLQTSSRKRRENGLFVLEGLRICLDAMENSIRFDKLIVSDTAALKYGDTVNSFVSNSDECFKIPDSLFEKISDTKSPQGIIAVCKIIERKSSEIDPRGRYVALENIADPLTSARSQERRRRWGRTGLFSPLTGAIPILRKRSEPLWVRFSEFPCLFLKILQRI